MSDRGEPARRPLWIVVVLLVLGAVALWGSSGMTWGATRLDAQASGAEVSPALLPTAVLSAAAIAAVVALGGWVRRLVGVVLVLAGVAVGFTTVAAGPPVAALSVALVGTLCVVGAGVVLVLRGGAMPRLGGGYQTPGAAKKSTDPEREMWNALERGDDPTERD
ncbi:MULTISPECIES: Trp biosynthesis-associated membrane protein [unclassified Saccharothrix]|uniref:Trp biosynthesis-associated membrane protein n=1 Tax=unclassified Saccharothrix TaxID=2593673 RepID=UPI00307CCB37